VKRYAIYYAPAESAPLTRAAAAWLGRDAFTGEALQPPDTDGISREQWAGIVIDPRVYGFHATLKPPFRLAEGTTEQALRERLRRFAAARRPFAAKLQLGSLARFLALVLSRPCPEFVALAADCVREFDDFRAQPSEEELARRHSARLNEAQLTYLRHWGYPYVMEEWRFHMTLSASLGPETFQTTQAHLAGMFGPLCRQPLRVDSICLFEQESQGAPFLARERFGFA
jgi:putative phosphonate metabolism protein